MRNLVLDECVLVTGGNGPSTSSTSGAGGTAGSGNASISCPTGYIPFAASGTVSVTYAGVTYGPVAGGFAMCLPG